MAVSRNYNHELKDANNATSEKYAYSFDFDVMHPYMIRSFEPFFRPGSLLELGSYQGQFTGVFLSTSTISPASKPPLLRCRKRSANWAIGCTISTRCLRK